MNPAGERSFGTAEAAKASAMANKDATSFAVIGHPNGLEYAWAAPIEFFLTRLARSLQAGIRVGDNVVKTN